MKINKEEEDKKLIVENKESTINDTANMEIQCHIIIKEKDTNEILVNKRG